MNDVVVLPSGKIEIIEATRNFQHLKLSTGAMI
jgi:hypothetical protein